MVMITVSMKKTMLFAFKSETVWSKCTTFRSEYWVVIPDPKIFDQFGATTASYKNSNRVLFRATTENRTPLRNMFKLRSACLYSITCTTETYNEIKVLSCKILREILYKLTYDVIVRPKRADIWTLRLSVFKSATHQTSFKDCVLKQLLVDHI